MPVEQLAGAFLDGAPDAMVITNDRGHIVFANTQAERLFGYQRDELYGASVETLVPVAARGRHDRFRSGYHAHPRTRMMGSGPELSAQRKDGSVFAAEVSLSPLETAGGTFVISAIRDVTARKRAEDERAALLRREQQARAAAEDALAQRDHVLAVVTHDLKNPLTAIHGWAQHLQQALDRAAIPATARLHRPLSRIVGLTSQMHAMLEELLDSARLQQGRPLCLDRHPTDLVAHIRQAVLEYSQMSEIHPVSFRATAPSLEGNWDAARLDRVIGNLLTNAIKYSPHGGPVDVAVSRQETAEGPEAVVDVRDRGIGIPAADVPHVFESFFRAGNVGRVTGTGIGLDTAQRIVQQQGGTISVESVEGRGTTFSVHLPLTEQRRTTSGPESNTTSAGTATEAATPIAGVPPEQPTRSMTCIPRGTRSVALRPDLQR
jgi:PAS domain S-box-containing protein